MLITFKSTAAAEITMLENLALYLLNLIGKQLGERGVITHHELAKAIQRLEVAIETEKKEDAAQEAQKNVLDNHHEEPREQPIGLAQRAFPLLDMMRTAYKREADILWGI